MKKRVLLICLVLISAISFLLYPDFIKRTIDGIHLYIASRNNIRHYELQSNQAIADISGKLKSDESVPIRLRKSLLNGNRKIVIFKFRSDGNEVAGYFSYLVKGEHPTLIFYRGGNGRFGIMRPNNMFSFIPGYNVVGMLYRGNVYPGLDELGGADINDTKYLLQFFPKLKRYTRKSIGPPYALLGVSRGATQIFGSLAHLPRVAAQVNKIISISGALDLRTQMEKRSEMALLFRNKFKQQNKTDFNHWISYRNPVELIQFIKPEIKILLIHGENDRRVSSEEQKVFVKAASKHGFPIKLINITGTGHGMKGKTSILMSIISSFLDDGDKSLK